MIYFLFYCTLCKTTYLFDDIKDNHFTAIFLESLDVAEIEVPKDYGTILSQWYSEEDLYIFVEADTIYGPIEYHTNLIGIYFNTYDYTIRFVNNGLDTANISVKFAQGIETYIRMMDLYYVRMDELNDNLTYPFMYGNESASLSVIMIIMVCLFGAIMFIPCWPVTCHCC